MTANEKPLLAGSLRSTHQGRPVAYHPAPCRIRQLFSWVERQLSLHALELWRLKTVRKVSAVSIATSEYLSLLKTGARGVTTASDTVSGRSILGHAGHGHRPYTHPRVGLWDPPQPRAREPCSSPTAHCHEAAHEAVEPDGLRPNLLDRARAMLGSLARRGPRRQAGHSGPVASPGVPVLLAEEEQTGTRSANDRARTASAHPRDEYRESTLGSAEDPRRVAEARHRRLRGNGVEMHAPPSHSPWQNPFVERIIGSIRRECTDHVIVLGERHLHRVLTCYFDYYHRSRTHLSLDKDPPETRNVEPPENGEIRAVPQVGGLHHRYTRTAA